MVRLWEARNSGKSEYGRSERRQGTGTCTVGVVMGGRTSARTAPVRVRTDRRGGRIPGAGTGKRKLGAPARKNAPPTAEPEAHV